MGTSTIKDMVAAALRQAVRTSQRRARLDDTALQRFSNAARRPGRRERDGCRMAVSPATWLIDKSVLARLGKPEVRQVMLPRLQAGRVAVSIVTELEVGFSARSASDYKTMRRTMLDYLVPVFVTPRAEERAREVQFELIRRGRHRAVSIPDLLVAAVAEIERLSVLHYDADFELVANITGEPVEWVVPPNRT